MSSPNGSGALTRLGSVAKKDGFFGLYRPPKGEGNMVHDVVNSGVRTGATVWPYSTIVGFSLFGASMAQNMRLKKKKKTSKSKKRGKKKGTKSKSPFSKKSK